VCPPIRVCRAAQLSARVWLCRPCLGRDFSVRNKLGRIGRGGHSAAGDSLHCPLGPRIRVRLIRSAAGSASSGVTTRSDEREWIGVRAGLAKADDTAAKKGAPHEAVQGRLPLWYKGHLSPQEYKRTLHQTQLKLRPRVNGAERWSPVLCPPHRFHVVVAWEFDYLMVRRQLSGDGTQILTGTWVTSSVLRIDLGTLRSHQ
jgi:hypothetical protein